MPTRIADLDRNDVPGAVAYLEQQLDAGKFTSDDGQTLRALQDDPKAFEEAVEKVIVRRRQRGEPLGIFK